MFVVESYPLAVMMCLASMFFWGSWANTQKLAPRSWRFQLFYWDYGIGAMIFAFATAFTAGSFGSGGRPFLEDVAQGSAYAFTAAFIGGVVFNLSNILVVAAIEIAGMAVAYPIGVGLSLVIGTTVNYFAAPVGNPVVLFSGVTFIVLAVVTDAIAYRRIPSAGKGAPVKGIVISLVAAVFMGIYYRFVIASMSGDFASPEAGKLTPYTAVVVFAAGIFVSNFMFNTLLMIRPFEGKPVPFRDYFAAGSLPLHLVGIVGGLIWCAGTTLNIAASGVAGYAISFGLGGGATMVGALWGVFVWKEFRGASPGTSPLLAAMFLFYVIGLGLIVAARLV